MSMKKSGQPVTLALIVASIVFGMVLAGGLHLTRSGQAGERTDDRPLHAAARAQMAVGQGAQAGGPGSFADIAEYDVAVAECFAQLVNDFAQKVILERGIAPERPPERRRVDGSGRTRRPARRRTGREARSRARS